MNLKRRLTELERRARAAQNKRLAVRVVIVEHRDAAGNVVATETIDLTRQRFESDDGNGTR